MADQIYLQDFDYFKGAKVLHFFEFAEPQIFINENFNELEVHAITICDYTGEETMLFYFDEGLEIIAEFEFLTPKQAKEKTAEDFLGIDINWRNK